MINIFKRWSSFLCDNILQEGVLNNDTSDLRISIGNFKYVGIGKECTIKEIARTVEDVVYTDVRKY